MVTLLFPRVPSSKIYSDVPQNSVRVIKAPTLGIVELSDFCFRGYHSCSLCALVVCFWGLELEDLGLGPLGFGFWVRRPG